MAQREQGNILLVAISIQTMLDRIQIKIVNSYERDAIINLLNSIDCQGIMLPNDYKYYLLGDEHIDWFPVLSTQTDVILLRRIRDEIFNIYKILI